MNISQEQARSEFSQDYEGREIDVDDPIKRNILAIAPDIPKDELARLIKDLDKQMKAAAKNLEFEKAALLRDRVVELRRELVGDEEGLAIISEMRSSGGGRSRKRSG